jgi:hypothetical protein
MSSSSIFRSLLDCLRKSPTFEDFVEPDSLVFEIQETLEDFYLVANSMNAAEQRLFAQMNNIAVPLGVSRLVAHSDIQMHCMIK